LPLAKPQFSNWKFEDCAGRAVSRRLTERALSVTAAPCHLSQRERQDCTSLFFAGVFFHGAAMDCSKAQPSYS